MTASSLFGFVDLPDSIGDLIQIIVFSDTSLLDDSTKQLSRYIRMYRPASVSLNLMTDLIQAGAFSWCELMTTDTAAATKFYIFDRFDPKLKVPNFCMGSIEKQTKAAPRGNPQLKFSFTVDRYW